LFLTTDPQLERVASPEVLARLSRLNHRVGASKRSMLDREVRA